MLVVEFSGHSTLYMVALVLCMVVVTLFSVCIAVFKHSRMELATVSGGIGKLIYLPVPILMHVHINTPVTKVRCERNVSRSSAYGTFRFSF